MMILTSERENRTDRTIGINPTNVDIEGVSCSYLRRFHFLGQILGIDFLNLFSVVRIFLLNQIFKNAVLRQSLWFLHLSNSYRMLGKKKLPQLSIPCFELFNVIYQFLNILSICSCWSSYARKLRNVIDLTIC